MAYNCGGVGEDAKMLFVVGFHALEQEAIPGGAVDLDQPASAPPVDPIDQHRNFHSATHHKTGIDRRRPGFKKMNQIVIRIQTTHATNAALNGDQIPA